MVSRRDMLQTAILGLTSLAIPGLLPAAADNGLDWRVFLDRLQSLAGRHAAGNVAADELVIATIALLRDLDVQDPEFANAVETAWESGNRYWFWQRLTREHSLLGGILTIEQDHPVPLHDHPGATGFLRILSGSAEVWQYDRIADEGNNSRLQRVSRLLLKAGDIAILQPARGNIHALQCYSGECRMLDYFIPPYEKRRRNWYLPVSSDWAGREQITCERVAEHEFHAG